MKISTTFSLSCLIVILAGLVSSGQAETNWQLVFRYDAGSFQLVKADPIASMSKQARTPGLESAALRIDCRTDWLDSQGGTLYNGTTQLPIGKRAAFADSTPCGWFVPDEGTVVVRLAGPDTRSAAASIKLTKTALIDRLSTSQELPPALQSNEWTFKLPESRSTSAALAGPVGVTKTRDTGPDENRLVIVIMGDGYTAANLSTGAFETAAASLGTSIGAKSPWDILYAATNIYRIDIESNESGSDNETYGVYKDTYLNSSFWVSDIERLLALTGDGEYLAVTAADNLVGPGTWDVILVLVNSTKYGGSGGGIAVSSVHSSASEIVIHELGHSFGLLADEYETAYPGFPPGDYEPNVDYDYSGPGLKWLNWVEAGTPLPTPEMSPYLTAVGAFEGARYLSTGIYRPWYNCEMRSLNRPFCPICKESHICEFTDMISLLDDLTPFPFELQIVGQLGAQFTATPSPLVGLGYTWSLDGIPIPGETSSTLLLTPAHMLSQFQTLELTVTLITPLVRKQVIASTYTWPVIGPATSCCTGIVGDANNDGAYEPTLGDIMCMVDHLFITGVPITCYAEADIDQSGGPNPEASDLSLGDIMRLVDYLFITGAPVPSCL